MENEANTINEMVDKMVSAHIKLLTLGVDYPNDFKEPRDKGELYYSVAEFVDDDVLRKYGIENYEAQNFLIYVKNDMSEMMKDLFKKTLGDSIGKLMFQYIVSNMKFYGRVRNGELWTLEMGNKVAEAYRAECEKADEKERLKNEFKAI